MLTDERPAIWHDDDYIRHWIADRRAALKPKTYIPLITVSPDQPDTAEIDCSIDGWPVRRFKRLQLTVSDNRPSRRIELDDAG